MRVPTLAILSVFIAVTAGADPFGCDETAPRRATISAAGASRIVILARAGSLKVEGRPGSEVLATGTACSSDSDFLDRIQLEARRNGSDVELEAVIPERMMQFGWHEARLDFEVAIPSSIPVVVKDSSGEAHIRNVAALEIRDGSGTIVIRGVRGNVSVHDGSGGIEIEDVGGDVEVRDGSGGIDIRDVQRNVRIAVDGSGGISVSDVRGDFIVARDGSGSIDHSRVSGRVSIPDRKH